MSAARTARRRRKQHALGFTHLARLGRPIYHRRHMISIAEAIQRERWRAQREQAIARKGKK